MIPKKNRITRKDFPSYKRQLYRFPSSLFSATLYPYKGENAQVSVVVSKKIAKKAVVRNKIRRRFYFAINSHLKDLHHISIVFYPKKIEKMPFSLLKSEMERMFSETTLLEKK